LPQSELLQSGLALQPHTPRVHWLPALALPQSGLPLHPHRPLVRHTGPATEFMQPGAHVPSEQQAPLHELPPSHAVVQVDVAGSQAVPMGHSLESWHPQVPFGMHTGVFGVCVQSAHVPDCPQLVFVPWQDGGGGGGAESSSDVSLAAS